MTDKKTEKYADFGDRLREERYRLELSPPFVAGELEVHTNTLFNYEVGKRDIPTSTLVKFANLGFDVNYIMFGKHAKK